MQSTYVETHQVSIALVEENTSIADKSGARSGVRRGSRFGDLLHGLSQSGPRGGQRCGGALCSSGGDKRGKMSFVKCQLGLDLDVFDLRREGVELVRHTGPNSKHELLVYPRRTLAFCLHPLELIRKCCQFCSMFTRICDGTVRLGLIEESFYFGQCCRDVGNVIAGEQIGSIEYEGVDSEDGKSSTKDLKEIHGRSGEMGTASQICRAQGGVSVEQYERVVWMGI